MEAYIGVGLPILIIGVLLEFIALFLTYRTATAPGLDRARMARLDSLRDTVVGVGIVHMLFAAVAYGVEAVF